MIPVGTGTIAGNLHNLGEYPALTLDGEKKESVRGTVFELPDDPELIQRLDEYEGFLPNDRANSLFIRSKQLITLDSGTELFCWVYTYNRQLPEP